MMLCRKINAKRPKPNPKRPLIWPLPKYENEKTITESEFKLSNVNVDIKLGELVMVVGSVGSGKSSLLMSLNEMPKVEGSSLER